MVARVLDIWISGGWVMLPLFAVAVLIYTQGIQLVLYVRRSRITEQGAMHWFEWVRRPDEATGNVADIIRYTQTDTSSGKQIRNRFDEIRMALVELIDRRARFVGTLVAAAPLLGLLGTVLGMLRTFLGIATGGGSETAGAVASGISEALVTTQTGLTIALPGLFLVMMIQRQKHKLEANLARLESLTLSHFKLEAE